MEDAGEEVDTNQPKIDHVIEHLFPDDMVTIHSVNTNLVDTDHSQIKEPDSITEDVELDISDIPMLYKQDDYKNEHYETEDTKYVEESDEGITDYGSNTIAEEGETNNVVNKMELSENDYESNEIHKIDLSKEADQSSEINRTDHILEDIDKEDESFIVNMSEEGNNDNDIDDNNVGLAGKDETDDINSFEEDIVDNCSQKINSCEAEQEDVESQTKDDLEGGTLDDDDDDDHDDDDANNGKTEGVKDKDQGTNGDEISESTLSAEFDNTDSASENLDELHENSTQNGPDTKTIVTQTDNCTDDVDENGIEINENDILKSVDEYGRGKRPRTERKNDLYVDHDGGDNAASKSPSSASKRGRVPRYCRSSINHDLLLVAFNIGWRRELVIRNVYGEYTAAGNLKKTPADVYYRTPPPKSRKLRSLKEVQKFLKDTKSPLTIENFSFLRESVSEPPYEFVRHAGKGRGCHHSPSVVKPEIVIERDGDDEDMNESMDTSTVDASPKVSTPTVSLPTPRKYKVTPGPGRPRKFGVLKIGKGRGRPAKLHPQKHSKFVYVHTSGKRKIETLIMDDPMLPPDMSSLDVKTETDIENYINPCKKHKAVARKSTTPKLSKPSSFSPPEYSGTEALCTLNCPGQENIPPSLHCSVCLCLFHPQCVAFPPNTEKNFVCLRCIDPSSVGTPKTTSALMTVAPPSMLSKESEVNNSVINNNTFSVASSNIKQEPVDTYEHSSMETNSVINQSTHQEANPVLLGHLRNNILDKQQVKGNVGSKTPPHMPMMIQSSGFPSVTTSSMSNATFSLMNSVPIIPGDGLRIVTTSVPKTPPRSLLIPSTNTSTVPLLTSAPLIPNNINLNHSTRTIYVPASNVSPLLTGNIPLTVSRLIGTKTQPVHPPVGISSSSPAVSVLPPRLTAAPMFSSTPTTPPSSNRQSPIANGVMSPVSKNEDTKTGQILTLPAAVSKRLNLQQPLALKINNMQIKVPPSSFLHTSDGLKVFLPPKTFPVQLGETAKLSVTVTNEKSTATSISVNYGDATNTKCTQNECNNPVSDTIRTRRWKPGINPGLCFFKRLYGGFDCMFSIFQYLNIKDLLRVSVVCKTWRQIAMHPTLWREVKFRNMKVPDWEMAVNFLSTRAVQALNLKGLLHNDDRNKTWHQLIAVLNRLSNLRCLRFGLVPASVLQALCDKMPHLEILTAEWISDFNLHTNQMWTIPTKVDVGIFASLKNLQELRLRGVAGLTLPSFSFSGGISQITKLEKLTTLSLTTLKDVADNEFGFLSELTNLHTLELGDCSLWSSETYFQLGRLSNLTSLHLECGGEIPDIGLGDALLNMKKLVRLELIMFTIAEGLHNSLSQLEDLKSMVIWPDTSSYPAALVNTCTLEVVSRLFMLETLEWGILTKKSSPGTDINTLTPMANSTEWIPLLPTNAPCDGSQLPPDTHPQYIGVRQFTKKISDHLPNTQIKVFSTSMLSARDCIEQGDS